MSRSWGTCWCCHIIIFWNNLYCYYLPIVNEWIFNNLVINTHWDHLPHGKHWWTNIWLNNYPYLTCDWTYPFLVTSYILPLFSLRPKMNKFNHNLNMSPLVQLETQNENICSNNKGTQDKGKIGWNSICHKNWWFYEFHPFFWMLMYFFSGFFNFTLCMTKLLVLCFLYFMDKFIAYDSFIWKIIITSLWELHNEN